MVFPEIMRYIPLRLVCSSLRSCEELTFFLSIFLFFLPLITSELRRPRDFIKGMAVAQILIVTVYLFVSAPIFGKTILD